MDSNLLVVHDGLSEVPKEVVSVAKVTTGSTLGRPISELLNYRQIGPKNINHTRTCLFIGYHRPTLGRPISELLNYRQIGPENINHRRTFNYQFIKSSS